MIRANPDDRGHASWASDEARRRGLARRPEHMGVGAGRCKDCRPLNVAG